MVVNYQAPAWLRWAPGELGLPFSDTVKYSILAISVTLLLLALGILAWQTFRCCTQNHAARTQDVLNFAVVKSDLLYLEEKPRTCDNYTGAPGTPVENVSTDVLRLSQCLSETSFTSLGSLPTDGHVGDEAAVKKMEGSLRFSVFYDQPQSRLVVTVLQVDRLLNPSQNHSLQPFVKLSLMWACSKAMEVGGCADDEGEGSPPVLWQVMREWRTQIVKDSCAPLFGDQFCCSLDGHKDLDRINLKMEVRDFDKFSRHTVLGEVRVRLGQLNISCPLELQEDLRVPQKDLVGAVLLSLKFLPTSQRLEIGLLKVKTVISEMCSDAALYARISVQCNQCKLRYQKTSPVARCLVTVFNEVLIFSLPEFPLQQCKILVSVYETPTTRESTKHLIGRLTVGKEKSSEDKHWSLMMHSIRKPVATWHGLLI